MTDIDIEAYRAAHAKEKLSRAHWVEAIIEQAEILHRKRGELGSHQAFGDWLSAHSADGIHNKDGRAALIHFGSNIMLAREVLTETDRICLHWIWQKTKARFLQVKKTEETVSRRVLRLVQECGSQGLTSLEGADELTIPSRIVSATLSQLLQKGDLIKTPITRGGAGRPPTVYIHRSFGSKRKLPPVERVLHPVTKLPRFTDEELGLPAPEEAHLPDLERPGLNRQQGHVARQGHVQIMPIKEAKRSIARRLNTMIRKLEVPLHEYYEQAVIKASAEEIADLMPTLDNADKTKERTLAAIRAVKENGERFVQHIQQLEAKLDGTETRAERKGTSAA